MNSTKSEKKAFCYSSSCTNRYASFHTGAIEKDVPRGTLECPRCHSILVWRKPKYRHLVKDTIKMEGKIENRFAE
jgi:hypothetical protein